MRLNDKNNLKEKPFRTTPRIIHSCTILVGPKEKQAINKRLRKYVGSTSKL